MLIRQQLPSEFRSMSSDIVPALEEFGAGFAGEGSDGIGRKTEAPLAGPHRVVRFQC